MTASEADVEADPEAYACATCPVADAWSELEQDAAALEAWGLFQHVCNRLTMDTHTAAVVLDKLAGDRDPDDFGELMDRFVLLYDVLCPAPERKES